MKLGTWPAVLLFLSLSGCAEQPIHPIDVNTISAVQAEIKRQVGIYMIAAKKTSAVPSGAEFWCGKGDVNFDIASVKAELTTSVENTFGVEGGATFPAGSVVTPTASAGYSHAATNSQVLTYNLWPFPYDWQANLQAIENVPITTEQLEKAPIAQVLLNLRDALVRSALRVDPVTSIERPAQPCFADYNPDSPTGDAGNTYTLGLAVTKALSGGISISVAVLTLSATGETKSTTGHTLTVSFVQSGLQEIQYLKETVDNVCEYPNGKSTECKNARDALQEAIMKGLGVGIMMKDPTK